jgi:A/G-specific adenine glycosylase
MPERGPKPITPEAKALTQRVLRWYRAHARDLPWRHSGPPGQRDAYQTLVSEFMLQQTQVTRVLEKFAPFIEQFPTISDLAKAPESAVLTAWSGLGYYRRARLLHAAARDVVMNHEGKIPSTVEKLIEIRGIGMYTAGALASMAFDKRVPLVDGNVSRVLQRVYAKPGRSTDKPVALWTWQTAEGLVVSLPQVASPGMFNEALMELGATVCTPKSPRCHTCPWQSECLAKARGVVDTIPTPKLKVARKEIHLAAFLVDLGKRQVLIEDRDDSGLFANLTQPPMIEVNQSVTQGRLKKMAAAYLNTTTTSMQQLRDLGTLKHTLTHRELHVTAYGIRVKGRLKLTRFNRRAAGRADLANLPLANVHRRLILMGLDFVDETTAREQSRG